MAVLTGLITAGTAIAKTTGFDPLKAGKNLIGNLFGGGGPKKNKGSDSLVDALDNYGAITSAEARSMESEVRAKIADGGSDYEIASLIRARSGATHSASSLMSGYKWPILKSWINRVRAQSNSGSALMKNPAVLIGGGVGAVGIIGLIIYLVSR